ncbi:MAG TPA: hypothetical protein VEO54_28825 [Thermoanaerobaculia bacterium]|nr:hypothetical protein [Thermoanaerobaculia bacterium]
MTLDAERASLVALNDPRLADLLRAEGEDAEREIERLIATTRTVTQAILARHVRAGTHFRREDAQDVEAVIHLRLVQKLRALATSPAEAIRNFHAYAATLTYNAVNDHLRKQFPERARLKTRVRYAASHDPRLAMWVATEGLLCGLAEWRSRHDAVTELPPRVIARLAGLDREDTAGALLEIFAATGSPVLLEPVVDGLAEAWDVVDHATASLDQVPEGLLQPAPHDDVHFMRALWKEIQELRPMQRKALLLNLRFSGETNVISLLVLARIARFDEIAAALELTRAELTVLWRALPMEDAAIAERFGLTRQQVINLRKSARERLARRLRP